MQAFKDFKAKAKDLDFGLKDQGQGLTSLMLVSDQGHYNCEVTPKKLVNPLILLLFS